MARALIPPYVLVALALGLFPAVARGEGVAIAEVESTTVRANAPFLLVIRAEGGQVGEPRIPEADGILIEEQPRQRSDTIELVNFNVRRRRVRGYRCVATREGAVRIPPIAVEIDDAVVHTEPIDLTVASGQEPYRGQAPPRPRGRPEPGRDRPGWEDLAFIESEVNRTEVYMWEPVRLTLRLWQMAGPGTAFSQSAEVPMPDTEGFYVRTLDPATSRATWNNWAYDVTEYVSLLYPTRAGDLVVGPWQWRGRARARTGFGYEEKQYNLETRPVRVSVRALPDPPPNFSGAVGRFSLGCQVTRGEVIQGVPTRLNVTIEGSGNPDIVGEPRIGEIPGAYVSGPERSTDTDPDGHSMRKTFSYTVTPLEPGELTIPEVVFVYFDPAGEEYVTERAGPHRVSVLRSVESDQRAVFTPRGSPGQVDVLSQDIMPLATAAGPLKPWRPSPWTVPLGTTAPVVAYGAVFLVARRYRKLRDDPGYARAYKAARRCRQALHDAAKSVSPADDLHRAIQTFVADLLDLERGGLTSADAKDLLDARGVAPEAVDSAVKVLKACERTRYGSGRLTEDEVHALIRAALDAVNRLDGAVKGGRR